MLLTVPGRIPYPDGEIVFETTEALVTRGSFGVDGIPFRTGEPRGRPDGSFGVEGSSPDGRRYGFFGHALSFAAMPTFLLGELVPADTQDLWRRAARRDVFHYHDRGDGSAPPGRDDWRRMATSLTNVWICALLAWVVARYGRALGFGWRPAVLAGMVTVLGTFLWAYGATFMSEPLSALMLAVSATSVARWRNGEGSTHAAVAGLVAGLSVHAHILNVLALPCLLGYAVLPDRARWSEPAWRRDVLLALGLAGLGLALLGLSQWLRFGSPFETGRHHYYAHFVAPWEGLAAQLVAPGRSIFLFAPGLALGLFGLASPELRRRLAPELWLVLAVFVTRLLFVSTRSDWYGGWSLGPRYLAPVLPLAAPLVMGVLEDGARRPWFVRVAIGAWLVSSGIVCGWLAMHSSSEHMHLLLTEHGAPEFYARSHWTWRDSPFGHYARMDWPMLRAWRARGVLPALVFNKLDVMWVGAYRLRLAGHPGLWRVALTAASIAVVAAWRLGALLWRPFGAPPTSPRTDGNEGLERADSRE